MTDDLLAGRPRSAQVLALSARAGAERLERGAAADEARLHGRGISRDAGAAFAQTIPDAAVTSDFIVGFCGETEEDFEATVDWCASRGSRTASSSSTASGPAPRGPSCYPDDVPEEVKRRRNNELLAMQNAISEEDNQPLIGRQVEVLVEGPEQNRPQSTTETGPAVAIDRPHALRPNRRVRRQSAARSANSAGHDLRRQRVHPVRQRRDRSTSAPKCITVAAWRPHRRRYTAACRLSSSRGLCSHWTDRCKSINCAAISTIRPRPTAGCGVGLGRCPTRAHANLVQHGHRPASRSICWP